MPVDTLIQLRKGTASAWSSANPILASGEPGWDTTNNILKIGNGTSPWSSLSAITNSGGGISNVVEDLTPQLGGILDLNNYSISGHAFYTSPSGTIVGTGGWVYQSGQSVRSEGVFSSAGDAQASQFILRGATTNNTWTRLNNNGTTAILLASNRTYSFYANILARSTSGYQNAAYKLEGLLYNDNNGSAIIGTPIKTIIGEDDASWDVRVAISGAGSGGSDYLITEVSGSTSTNINWVAKLDLLEVGGFVDGYGESNILKVNNKFEP